MLDVEVLAGGGYRANSSLTFDNDRPWDTSFGLSGWYRSPDRYAFGVGYQLTGLGRGESGDDPFVSAKYDAHSLWLQGRIFPRLFSSVDAYAGLGVGLAMVRAVASGTRRREFTQPGSSFLCRVTTAPGLALAGSVGAILPLGRRVSLLVDAGARFFRGSSDLVDGCVLGLGSPLSAAVQAGLSYELPL